MERKVLKSLQQWQKKPNRMPLLLQGARQVGKTYIALEFGKRFFANTVYLNFEAADTLNAIFQQDLNPHRIIKEISALLGQTILPKQTLLIFDEIQASERALTSLKYFSEDASEYCIIAAGSLLGVAVNRNNYSFPVGKVDMLTMYPLDFEEFLWTMDKKPLSSLIRDHYDDFTAFSLHEAALELYRQYLVIGGMPRPVKDFIDTHDYNVVLAAQKMLNDSYIADMAKYATPSDTTRNMATWNSLSSQLAKENKKFQYKAIASGARAYSYAPCLDWLKAAGMINKCNLVTEGNIPLSAYVDNSAFKVYIVDTGLLCSKFTIPANVVLNSPHSFNGFKGALAENYIMQCLVANKLQPYYWNSNGKAELDFVFQNYLGEIIPVEVKSADNVRAKSLHIFMERYHIPYAYRISTRNFGYDDKIKSVPLYAAFCIEN